MTETLVGYLSLDTPADRMSFLINKINDNIRPPRPANPENVNIRAMYLANDLTNTHGGQFRRDDLERLCGLIIDTPVLVGHNHSEPPLARTFYADLETRDKTLWLKSYFYWPKISGTGDELLSRIDSGVLKECSIAFVYTNPECGFCAEDFRACPHRKSGETHFYYHGITQVLETSLVYKGSVRGTYISDKLSQGERETVTIDNGDSLYTVELGPESLSRGSLILPYGKSARHRVTSTSGIRAAIVTKDGQNYLVVNRA